MSNFKKQLLAGPYLIWMIGFILLPLVFILYYAITAADVAFRTKCKIFSRHLQNSILKTEKGRFKGL